MGSKYSMDRTYTNTNKLYSHLGYATSSATPTAPVVNSSGQQWVTERPGTTLSSRLLHTSMVQKEKRTPGDPAWFARALPPFAAGVGPKLRANRRP